MTRTKAKERNFSFRRPHREVAASRQFRKLSDDMLLGSDTQRLSVRLGIEPS